MNYRFWERIKFLGSLLIVAMLLSSVAFAQSAAIPPACSTADVDDDDDGLIEICYIEDLDAVRHQLDGSGYKTDSDSMKLATGCPQSGCNGYELARDLDFADAASYRDAANRSSYTEGVGWSPIGDADTPFSSTFTGNNHRLSHLRIQRSDADGVFGLFADTSNAAHIDGVALTSLAIDITSHDLRGDHVFLVGALVARNRGAITNSSAHGDITVRIYFPASLNNVEIGGLVAHNMAPSARIANCYVLVRSETIFFEGLIFPSRLGGLVAANGGTIRNSYAIADLSVRDVSDDFLNNRADLGGLVAMNQGTIRDSYALAITEANNLSQVRRGGLVAELSAGPITNSYWDAEFSGIASGVGTPQTSVALQSPIAAQSADATQAYYKWESADWDFGSSGQYPILKYNDERCTTEQAPSYCGQSLAAQGSLLRSLAVSSGGGLSSRFSPLVAEHTIAVSVDRKTIELKPNTFAADAVLSVQRGTQKLADITSGDSTTIAIEQASTTVTFTVRSANRQSRDYRFMIHRLNDVVDVDADNDGLIEISKLEDLNAVRYQPDGSGYRTAPDSLKLTIGCPQSGCNGYELIDDLDFADATSYRDAANQATYYADTDGWQPLKFWGAHFDGNGHTIANLKVQTAGSGGLFASLGVGSRLSRVGLLDVDISGGDLTGALVAFADFDSRVEHCHASGRVEGGREIGGLVGRSSLGGLVSHSHSSVAVTGANVVGGLVGRADLITDSYASSDVIGSGSDVGGLAGISVSIIGSHANSSVTGDFFVGGLVGTVQSLVSNSYASGAVAGNLSVGGLAGFFSSDGINTIINSYAVASVSGGMVVGGLVGTTDAFSGQQYRITNCYALGELSGTAVVGGLVGRSRGLRNSQNPARSDLPVSISNSYWNTQTSGVTTSVGEIQAPDFPNQEGIGLSTMQMQSPQAPGTTSTEAYYNWSTADWDFGNSMQYPAVRRSGSSALVARQRVSLASLTVQAGEQLLRLDTELMQRDIEVGFDIEQITVVATTATPVIVTVDGTPLINGERTIGDLVVLQPRTIRIVLMPQRDIDAIRGVLDESGSTRTYIITVVRQLSADLRALSMSSGNFEPALSPAFSSQHYDYTAQVPNRIAKLTVAATAVDSEGTTIEFRANGDEVDLTTNDVTKSAEFALVEGGTTILTVLVKSKTDPELARMYTIAVRRPLSSDAMLRELHVPNSVLMPNFDPEISTYTVIVSSTNTAVRVVATPSDERATIEVNDQRVASGERSDAIAVAAGATTPLRIVVTAQDGISQQTYTVAVQRLPSSDAMLQGLRIPNSVLMPDFDSDTSTYTAIVMSASTAVRVIATASNEYATIEVNDQKVASGERSDAIAVAAGTTITLTIVVTAHDSISQQTYTVAVQRPLSNDASLQELHVPNSVLIPDFAPDTSTYTAIVVNASTAVRVVAMASNEYATIEVNGQRVASGERSDAIVITTDTTTTLTIVVTAQDGISQQTYTVAVRHFSDVRLKELRLSEGVLHPDFDSEISTYTVTVSSTEVTVLATASDEHTTIEVNGQRVVSGERSGAIAIAADTTTTLTIMVAAPDGTAQETYTVIVNHSSTRPFIRIRSRLFLEAPLP